VSKYELKHELNANSFQFIKYFFVCPNMQDFADFVGKSAISCRCPSWTENHEL